MTRRRFGGLLAAGLAAAGCTAVPTATPTPSPAALPTSGAWLITQNGNFVRFDLANRRETQITQFKDALAAGPSLSPDRQRIAYTYYVLPTDPNNQGGADLFVMNVDGTNQKLARAHGQSGASFVDPCWAADGRALYASLRAPIVVGGQAVGTSMEIVRVPLDGGDPTGITSGESPTASSDGKALAFVTTDKAGLTHLWVGKPDGSDVQEPLASRGFTLVQEPRFSPDGKHLAFAAVGGPAKARRSGPAALDALLAPFLPGVAFADGTPMDIWSMRPDGSDLRQLTHAQDHSPYPAWSPDGRWLAVAGELSLTLVDPAGARAQQLSSNARATGVAWL